VWTAPKNDICHFSLSFLDGVSVSDEEDDDDDDQGAITPPTIPEVVALLKTNRFETN
jgi:hypothetical protein